MSNLQRLHYFENNTSWSLENFLQWSTFYARDFGSKDDEHRIYKTYLENICKDPNLIKSRDNETVRKLAEEALEKFRDEVNSVQIDDLWRKCPSFLETLKKAIDLNADKMASRVAVLHDNFSDTIFNVTQDQLRSGFERKRSYFFDEKSHELQPKKTKTSNAVEETNDENYINYGKRSPTAMTNSESKDPISVSGNNDHSDQPTRESSINLDFSFGSIESANYDIGLGSYEEGTEINPDLSFQETDEDLTVPVSEQPFREDIWGQWKLGSGKIITDLLAKSANKKGHPLRPEVWGIARCGFKIAKPSWCSTDDYAEIQRFTRRSTISNNDSAIQQQNISESDYGGYIIHPSLKCMLSGLEKIKSCRERRRCNTLFEQKADGIFVVRLKKSFVEVGHLEMSGGHGHRDFSRSTWDGCCKLPIGNAYMLEEIGERFRGASCETFSKIKNRIELWRMHVPSRGVLQYERTHRATVPICFEDERKCIFDFVVVLWDLRCWLLEVTNVIYKLREEHNDSDVNVSNLSSGILPLHPFIPQKDKHKKGITTTYAKSEPNSSFIRSGQ
ncbi:11844_t:CDS:10 [Diversispora eburnea]|uniref:11844_t:CDS:1 n=1 Tax=Diversispora eburnea TaxID=1213867 RepID=A0A9N9CCR6_9GLOM|nr:11844_t:CDS:10 [Diversispora eburnea]